MISNQPAWSDRLTARLRRMQESSRRFSTALDQPRPRVVLDLGAWVPGWMARLVSVALGTAAVLVLHPAPFATVLLGVALALLAIRPNAITGAAFCGLTGLIWLMAPPTTWPTDAALIALGAATWMLAAPLSGLSARTRIEVAALLPSLWRYLIIQAISQLLLAGGLLLGSLHLSGSTVTIVAVCCGAGIAAAGWLAVPHLSTKRD